MWRRPVLSERSDTPVGDGSVAGTRPRRREVPPGSGSSRFSDVDPGVWWSPYVERLAELEVTAGCATGPLRFCPDEAVTRGQMATFMVRAFGLDDAAAAGFADTGGNTHASSIDALA